MERGCWALSFQVYPLFLLSWLLLVKQGSVRVTCSVRYLAVIIWLVVGSQIMLSSGREDHLQEQYVVVCRYVTNFLITTDSSFTDMCGVVLGNSFFFGLLMFACYQTVRWFFHRNRPTQLYALSGPNHTDDD